MKNNTQKLVGVLGGMGPLSSVQFYKEAIDYSQKELGLYLNKDYPHFLISNLPVPDLISSTRANSQSRKMVEIELKRMKKAGIKVAALACNTMHLYVDEFKKNSKLKFINILEESAQALVKKRRKKTGILATPTTLKHELYQKALRKRNISYVLPNKKEIETLGKLIPKILGGKTGKSEKTKILKIIKRMYKRDIDSILFGCTELGFVVKQSDVKVELINSITVLARAVTEVSLGRRKL